MSTDTPAAVLFDKDGIPATAEPAVIIPIGTDGFLMLGRDPGGVARVIAVDVLGGISTSSPVGGATEATLLGVKAGADKIPAFPAQDRTLPAAPFAVRLSNGAAFVSPTTPADTQPVSVSALPLPSGASTESTLAGVKTAVDNLVAHQTDGSQKGVVRGGAKGTTTSADVTSNPIDANTQALHVDGSKVVQPISVGALPLPAGAATETTLASAKTDLDALNTHQTDGTQKSIARGGAKGSTAAADLTSNPVDANTQALHVDGSKVVQPVSGTITANIGTSGSLALDGTLTGGTAKSIARGGTKGATTAGDITGTAEGADHQAMDVQLYHGGVAKDPTAIRTLTSTDVVTAAQGNAAVIASAWPVKITDGTNSPAVKSASTPASATDAAFVVAISPNNIVPISASALPLPTGASTESSLVAQSIVDNAPFTDGTTRIVPSGYVFDETAGTSLTENDVAAARVDSKRAQVFTIEDGTVRGQRQTITAAGAAKVDGSAVVQPVAFNDTAPATLNITAFDTGTTTISGANGQPVYIGTPTAGAAAVFALSAIENVSIETTGIFTGTMVVEVSIDGGTLWVRPNVHQIGTSSYANAFTGAFVGVVNVANATHVRVRGITSWTGTATIVVRETSNSRMVTVGDALPPGTNAIGTVTANIGTAGALALDATLTGGSAKTVARGGAKGTTVAGDITSNPVDANTQALHVDGSKVVQPVSASALPLPSGASTEATLAAQSLVDNAPFTDGTSRVVPAGYIFDETAGATLTENDVGAARVDIKRAVITVIEDGTNRGTRNTVKAPSTPAASADTAQVVAVSPNRLQTYSATTALTGLAMAAAPTDVFTITGSGTKTIRITRVEITGTATLSTTANVFAIKRSTADTAGTSTSPTAVPHASTNAAATATLAAYTANPTVGTSVGPMRTGKVFIPAVGTSAQALVWDFGTRESQAVILIGTTQVLAVNFNGVTVTGGNLDISVEWTEE